MKNIAELAGKGKGKCKADTITGRVVKMFQFEHLQCLKCKVKCTHVQALRLCTGRTAHRGSRSIAILFLNHGTRRGWGISVTPGRSLPPGKTRYPLYRRLDGPQDQSGQVRKISLPPGFDPRIVQPIASRFTDWATRPKQCLKFL